MAPASATIVVFSAKLILEPSHASAPITLLVVEVAVTDNVPLNEMFPPLPRIPLICEVPVRFRRVLPLKVKEELACESTPYQRSTFVVSSLSL